MADVLGANDVSAFKITADFGDAMKALDDIGNVASEGFTRSVAGAGSYVLYKTYRDSVPVETKPRKYKGKQVKLGGYRDSIYQVFSDDNSGDGRSTYHVAWNHRKFGFGFMLEFGHGGPRPAPAKAYLRKAYEMAEAPASAAMVDRLNSELAKLGL